MTLLEWIVLDYLYISLITHSSDGYYSHSSDSNSQTEISNQVYKQTEDEFTPLWSHRNIKSSNYTDGLSYGSRTKAQSWITF